MPARSARPGHSRAALAHQWCKLAKAHTTVSVERATLRLAGLTGADHEGQPWVNHLVDAVRGQVGLEHGVTTPVFDALRAGAAPDLLTLAQTVGRRLQ
jgi:beta-lysine 5,6-aminomutase alpha subunit